MDMKPWINKICEYYKDRADESEKDAWKILHNYPVELRYIEYKYACNPDFDILKEFDKVESLYKFNEAMRREFDATGYDSYTESLRSNYRSVHKRNVVRLLKPVRDMDVFYDGRPFRDIL